MSDYHVLGQNQKEHRADVVFHIPIADENNSVGVNLRTAVSQYVRPRLDDGSLGDFQSEVSWITAPESALLQSGDLFEHSEIFEYLQDETDLQKQTKIDARYTTLKTKVLDKIRKVLQFWGKDRDVP